MTVVLDASAVLALLFDEPGKEIVLSHAYGARLLSVNLSEILTRVIDKNGDPESVLKQIKRLEFQIVSFDEMLAISAAKLREVTKHIGASLGDRACLALAVLSDLPVLTADQKWGFLDIGIDIRLIR
jgi:PIN domain nuclease of toxin-antitoxin system